MFQSYVEVIQFMEQQKKRVYSLEHFKKYMQDCGNPQYALPCIHIGGTNGKGSTTNYISQVLQTAGYRVATFTSPPLGSRLDVIQINGVSISEQEMIDLANTQMEDWLRAELSIFEIEVWVAIHYFLENNVDIAIFEVGLGGTLDGTNIIRPLVAVNTNIGRDHTEYLGYSYKEIARNKGGIIKEGIAFITGEKKQECVQVFHQLCKQKHSLLLRVQPITDIKVGQTIQYTYRDRTIGLQTPAVYQVYNSALAIEVLYYLQQKGDVAFTDHQLLEGLYHAKWSGRFEKIYEHPTVIIDGAHNKEGIEAFCQSAKNYPDCKIIFSALQDKELSAMVQCLLQLSDDVTVCEFSHPRSASLAQMSEGVSVKQEKDCFALIERALLEKKTIFITGSLYFIAQVRAYLLHKKGESTF